VKTIVVGYDGSECAKRALDRAVQLSGQGTKVEVVAAVHITPQVKGAISPVDPIEKEERERDLDEAAKALAQAGVEGGTMIVHGEPARALAHCAEEVNADLIVVGTHGRGTVGRALRGSVSAGLIHHAPCDVLIVR
jgi:nucleotide-binding universal stress UspA family protein